MRILSSLLIALLVGCQAAPAPQPEPGPTVVSNKGLVVSVSSPASVVGRDVLARGGNAVDAAVATALALAVTFPEAGNIGGGGFMLVHFPDGRATCVDYREMARQSANATMFQNPAQRTAVRMAGVPGTVRGLALAHGKYGKLAWKDLVSPAVKLAREGFVLNKDCADSLNRVLAGHKDQAELQRVFGKPGGGAWAAGDRLVQPELAKTLELIADSPDAFYTGAIAEQIVAELRGLMTRADLAAYVAKEREPIRGRFKGCEVIGAPPPSSGGITLAQMLHVLEGATAGGRFDAQTLHYIIEAQRRAYANRAKHLGDPDYSSWPENLIYPAYGQLLLARIDATRATPSATLTPEIQLKDEPENTTHFSVIDSDGMAVSNTYTLENSYGGKIVVKGAGFLLNDELGDFNPQPGVTTRTGQIGTAANLAAPKKRPLSSMTPTIVTRDGKVVIVTGSPGGRTIINTVMCVVLNRLAYGMSPREAVDAPRQHHQWFPDRSTMEAGLHEGHKAAIERLRAMGHEIDATPRRQGDAHSIFWDEGAKSFVGVADQRRSGTAAGR